MCKSCDCSCHRSTEEVLVLKEIDPNTLQSNTSYIQYVIMARNNTVSLDLMAPSYECSDMIDPF